MPICSSFARRVSLSVLPLAVLACDDGPAADAAAVCTAATCVREAAPTCAADLQARLVPATQGTCAGDDGRTCAYAEPTREACGADGVCVEGACVTVASLCDWPFGDRLSIQNVLAVGNQSDDTDPATGLRSDACCSDFDGDGKPDNKLGEVFRSLRAALLDINPYFADQIANGDFNLLYDVRGLDDLLNDDHVEVLVYESLPDYRVEQTNPTTSGTGTFIVKQRSWAEHTRIPRLHLTGRVEQGHLIMDTGTFAFYFATSDGGSVVELPFERFVFDGSVALGPNGVGLALDATLGGLIAPRALYAALNNEIQWGCACAGYAEGQPFGIDVDAGTCYPAAPHGDACDEVFCQAMTGDFCDTVVSLFSPDIDTDGDGVADRISAGLFLRTTSAQVSTDRAHGNYPIEMRCPELPR